MEDTPGLQSPVLGVNPLPPRPPPPPPFRQDRGHYTRIGTFTLVLTVADFLDTVSKFRQRLRKNLIPPLPRPLDLPMLLIQSSQSIQTLFEHVWCQNDMQRTYAAVDQTYLMPSWHRTMWKSPKILHLLPSLNFRKLHCISDCEATCTSY